MGDRRKDKEGMTSTFDVEGGGCKLVDGVCACACVLRKRKRRFKVGGINLIEVDCL